MRIVLSRKGVDSSAGGLASPILDGSLVSLPIPGRRSEITYADLTFGKVSLGKLIRDLSDGNVSSHQRVHLDPDILRGLYQYPSTLVRRLGERHSVATTVT
jgi:hypothetical protein